jgi:DNA-binding NarL/FixJ family response regulator
MSPRDGIPHGACIVVDGARQRWQRPLADGREEDNAYVVFAQKHVGPGDLEHSLRVGRVAQACPHVEVGSIDTHVRVLVADDHPALRASVRAVLERGGFRVCAEASTGPEAVAAALREHPDICLLDIDMPGSGIAAAEDITSRLPEVAVVMLTVSSDDGDLFDALRAGARGYLLKDIDPERLQHALLGVLEGEAALPRSLVARLFEEFRHRSRRRQLLAVRGRRIELTSREGDVLDLLCQGLMTAEIAERLFISPVTVRRHIGKILRKLDAEDRAAALRLLEDASAG